MRIGLAVIVLASLTACTTSIPPTPAPTAVPTVFGDLTASPGALRSDPDLTTSVERGKRELMDANITEACAPAMPPIWCGFLSRSGDRLRTQVEASSYYVSTDLPPSDASIGVAMCREIADRTLDREGLPIGVYRVVILGRGVTNLAECEAL